MKNLPNSDDHRVRMADTVHFFLNYTRAYFDSFRIKDNRFEVWPILFTIKNHYSESDFTVETVKILVETDYDIVLSNHIVRSRVFDLNQDGYLNLNSEILSVQDVKSDTRIQISKKFTEGFSAHAAECAWRLLPSYHRHLWNPEWEDNLNKMIHDMVEQHRKRWCAFVKGQLMGFCSVKNPVRIADFRKKILSNDVHWMMIASAWRHHLTAHDQKEFTFDDMNHWLNRRSYVPVEVARDALSSLTSVRKQSCQNKDSINLPIFNKCAQGGSNVYSFNNEIVDYLIEHTTALDEIRTSFYDLYLSMVPSGNSLSKSSSILQLALPGCRSGDRSIVMR